MTACPPACSGESSCTQASSAPCPKPCARRRTIPKAPFLKPSPRDAPTRASCPPATSSGSPRPIPKDFRASGSSRPTVPRRRGAGPSPSSIPAGRSPPFRTRRPNSTRSSRARCWACPRTPTAATGGRAHDTTPCTSFLRRSATRPTCASPSSAGRPSSETTASGSHFSPPCCSASSCTACAPNT